MALADILFFLGAVAITLSYLFNNMLSLRLLAMAGALCYALGGLAVGHEVSGMKVLIFFSILTFLINFYHFFMIVFHRTFSRRS